MTTDTSTQETAPDANPPWELVEPAATEQAAGPAPSTAPQTWPAPPTTAMNRYSMPIFRPKAEGLTVRWKCANSQPDSEASTAASTNVPEIPVAAMSIPARDGPTTRVAFCVALIRATAFARW